MNMYWGVEVHFHALLTSALVASEPSASRPGSFTSDERVASPIEEQTVWNPGVDWTLCTKREYAPGIELQFSSLASRSLITTLT
jgi:hypothetical protein